MEALPNPFMVKQPWFDVKFAEKLLEAIEPTPTFIRDPSPEYMTAIELMPLLEVLTAYR